MVETGKMKERDLSIDYARGIAILIVFLGHSIIYHPIELAAMYDWCDILGISISSYNMPLFFLISGLLFGFSKKDNITVLKDKVKRLFVPYVFAMTIIHVGKLMLPSSMAWKQSGGGIIDVLTDIFLMGGDRWFVYVLLWIFILSLVIRPVTKSNYVFIFVILSFLLTIFLELPNLLLFDKVVKYIPYFLIGVYTSQYYKEIRTALCKSFFPLILLFAVMNVFFVRFLFSVSPLKVMLLPFVGSALIMSLSFYIEDITKRSGRDNWLSKSLQYCGKYSLQFYLFELAYPIIRIEVARIIPETQPLLIILFVFVLQLISAIITVEISKRLSFFKPLMGY